MRALTPFFALSLLLGCGEPDRDGDGFIESVDCDDDDPDVNPDALESCDGIDNDCANGIDDPSAMDAPVWYVDSDGDGFGDPERFAKACNEPSGWVTDNTDCDDEDEGVNPEDGGC